MDLAVEYLPNYKLEDWGAISKKHASDAGIDLRAAISSDLIIPAGEYAKVPLGIQTEFPEGFEAQLRARSGLAAKHGIGLVNGVGTIDCDYRGEWQVVLYNYSQTPFMIEPGDRVCQVVFNVIPLDIHIKPVFKLVTKEDRGGGFGSTGVK